MSLQESAVSELGSGGTHARLFSLGLYWFEAASLTFAQAPQLYYRWTRGWVRGPLRLVCVYQMCCTVAIKASGSALTI